MLAFLGVGSLLAEPWTVLGPDGGDARSLAYDPRSSDRIFLGTGTGMIFLSTDGGRRWSRFAHLGKGDDYVLDHIVIDRENPEIMYVSAWSVMDEKNGDLFRTRDGGATWEALPGMRGKSIRALAIAASDPSVLTAGCLDGVYRSQDGGDTWERISPANHAEIKNVESIAVDPKDSKVVYAGTWHLAWKTEDAGATWRPIRKGMVDDSDVFSIIVDSTNSSVVFASACSGIYKSNNMGELFQKIQGIPFSARRTRVLKQDPSHPGIVYAGTTEGLWKTIDAGKTWKRMSRPEIVVNDVLIDPRNSERVLLATDRSGVMASDDGSQTLSPSNHGYTHRYVTAIVVDKYDPDTIFVGVANDREWGGVFSFHNGAQRWRQMSAGLGGRDVFTLKQASDGTLVAGTNRGIFVLEHGGNVWRPINRFVIDEPQRVPDKRRPGKPSLDAADGHSVDLKVNEIDVNKRSWLAATSAGLFRSSNAGQSWAGGPVQGKYDFIAVQSNGELEVAATRTDILVSTNGGRDWQPSVLPSTVTSIRGVTVTPDARILVASREGGFLSSDSGATWERMANGLPDRDITSIAYDPEGNRLLATSMTTGVVFESTDGGRVWRGGLDSGYPLRRVNVVRGRFVAATLFDGVIFSAAGTR
jgi:photosystem II stability/assembly factor-like uncharacterized protein